MQVKSNLVGAQAETFSNSDSISAGKAGRLLFNTDGNRLCVDDGTNIRMISSTDFDYVVPPGNATLLKEALENDGIVASSILIPPGIYDLGTESITVSSNVKRIQGSNANNTKIQSNLSTGIFIDLSYVNHGCTISDIEFRSNHMTNVTKCFSRAVYPSFDRAYITDCSFYNFYSSAYTSNKDICVSNVTCLYEEDFVASEVRCFHKCIDISNVYVANKQTTSGANPNFYGFSTCEQLTNCYVDLGIAREVASGKLYGYYYCKYLTNCQAAKTIAETPASTYSVDIYGFYYCGYISSCRVNLSFNTNNTSLNMYAFYGSNYINGSAAYFTGTHTGNVNNCKGVAAASYVTGFYLANTITNASTNYVGMYNSNGISGCHLIMGHATQNTYVINSSLSGCSEGTGTDSGNTTCYGNSFIDA